MQPTSGRPKRITLADVARVAGVSVQTASHVLTGNKTVRLPEVTRQKVREAAVTVGYTPNRHAQAIRGGKTQIISIWIPVDRPQVNYLRMLHAINIKARESGYELMIAGLDRSAFTPDAKTPISWPVDGILAIDASKAVEAYRREPSNASTPIVILGYEEFTNGDAVAWDLLGAVKGATTAMIDRGFTNIVHATTDWILADFPRERRRRGYTEAMEEAGLEPKFVGVAGDSSTLISREVAEYIVKNGLPQGFTSFTDTVAIGVARAVLQSGFSVPGDCMVWGFGNFPESEDFLVPISTLKIPIDEVIDQAWTWLMERIENPSLPSRFSEVPMEPIERQSTQPLTPNP